MNMPAADIVIERIDSEVATLGIIFKAAVDVITQQPTGLALTRFLITLCFTGGGVVSMAGAEGRNFNDFTAEMHMDQFEAPAN